jgi:hypothetical protein
LSRPAQEQTISAVQAFQEVGGLLGRFVLAFLAVRILSRRKLLRVFQVPGLVIVPFVFLYPALNDLGMLKWGAPSALASISAKVRRTAPSVNACLPDYEATRLCAGATKLC